MICIGHLTIRPIPREGESLNSYLMRICKANMISYMDLLRYVQPVENKDVFYRRSIRIDIMPQQKHDMSKLAILLRLSENKLFEMTYDSLRLKLNQYGLYLGDDFLTLMPLLLESKLRKFCPLCLKENFGFQLLWQVKNIDCCIKHNIKLSTNCPSCNQKQNYFHNNLGSYRCNHCDSALFFENETFERIDDYFAMRKFLDWQYILDPQTQLFPESDIGVEKMLCISFIYFLQFQLEEFPTNYNYNLVKKKLRHDYLHSIIRYINDKSSPQKVTFSYLMNVLSKENLRLEDFAKVKVPKSYTNSLFYQEEISDKFKCLTPWCVSYQESDSLVEIPFLSYSYHKKEKYSKNCICKNVALDMDIIRVLNSGKKKKED
ncbi:TniQ family protein [Paenibacillus sp. NPDC058177]|uniref:TniQ family protein n=1 Tax=Paenibacillus sp. NPDC058177 TaxID=3346369 RepID=UPI0036D7D777